MRPDATSRTRGTAASVLALALASATLLGACSQDVIKHGHQFRDTDLQAIQPGMSQEQVKTSLGSTFVILANDLTGSPSKSSPTNSR